MDSDPDHPLHVISKRGFSLKSDAGKEILKSEAYMRYQAKLCGEIFPQLQSTLDLASKLKTESLMKEVSQTIKNGFDNIFGKSKWFSTCYDEFQERYVIFK